MAGEVSSTKAPSYASMTPSDALRVARAERFSAAAALAAAEAGIAEARSKAKVVWGTGFDDAGKAAINAKVDARDAAAAKLEQADAELARQEARARNPAEQARVAAARDRAASRHDSE